jgi:hypothetical protein
MTGPSGFYGRPIEGIARRRAAETIISSENRFVKTELSRNKITRKKFVSLSANAFLSMPHALAAPVRGAGQYRFRLNSGETTIRAADRFMVPLG